MKKRYLLLILQLLAFLSNAQKNTNDSIYIYYQKNTFIDSFVNVENVNYSQMYNIVVAKLKMEHYISIESIEKIIHEISKKDSQNTNCDSIKIFLIKNLINNSSIQDTYIKLLLLQKKYIDDSGCRTKKYAEMRTSLLEIITEVEYKLKLENDLSLLINRNELGKDYLRKKNYALAEKQFSEVLSYPFYNIEDEKDYLYKEKSRAEYRKAGINMLETRRGSLDKLQNTFFIPAFWEILEPIKKRYIEEMGGEYKHPSTYYKPKEKQ